jgi:regulation of enolase protein 1 (concanavalin A-like superfamily)
MRARCLPPSESASRQGLCSNILKLLRLRKGTVRFSFLTGSIFRRFALGIAPAVIIVLLLNPSSAIAQVESGGHSRPRITQAIDEANRVVLAGNVRPEASLANDRGAVPDSFRMEHMLLQLKRSPAQEQALQQFIDELHTKGSPNFHHWVTAQEFGDRFGLSQPDLNAITAWLQSHGFQVNGVYPSGTLIDFSGTAGQVRQAFQTEIHRLQVKGESHIANVSDPRVPAALAPVVAGVVSLHDFRPHTMHKMRQPRSQFTFPDPSGGNAYAVVPADLAKIYNLNPLFTAGISGQGQTIVLIEDTDVFTASDWSTFRQTFGLSSYTSASFTQVHPPAPSSLPGNNCGAPGVIAPNDAEAILDAEWASASAPSAAIEMAACADTTTTFGGLIAIQNLINASTPPPAIMSISYGQCETVNGAAANASYNSAYQQAVTEGVSVFVAAGDSGAAGCDNSVSEATHGIGVNAFASTPNNVAVGGTDFSDTFSGTNANYWSSSNTSAFGSALSYIPEIPWNDSCAGALLSSYLGFSPTYGSTSLCNDAFYGSFFMTTVGGGGGPSQCATGTPSTSGVVSGTCTGWPKPSWQSVLGNPRDGVRDTPDVSLFAADGLWSHFYIFCWSDTKNGGTACGSDPSAWSGAGGTSFASPTMAGIQALINQKAGGPQGNPAPVYYQLASSEYGSGGNSSCNSSNGTGTASTCIFYDVTLGDMDVDCAGPDCYLADGSVGVLSTSNTGFLPAYGTTTGWDFATGIGTVNAANLVNNWSSATSPQPTFSLSASPATLTFVQGASGSTTITINPLNGFSGNVNLTVSGLPSGVSATFGTNPATTSSLLTLSATATATTGTVTVTVTGTSGSLTNTTTVSLTVNPAPVPTFTLSAAPNSLTIVQRASGTSTITITPQNGFSSSVSLSASGLPSGVTASFNPSSATSASTLTLTASATATTGTSTATITGTSGSLVKTTSITLTVRLAPTLPLVWSDGDIGSTGVAGSAGYANDVFTVSGAGAQIYGTADAFHFVYQPLTGDGTIVARLVSVQGGTGYVSPGVMIRETLNAGAANAGTVDWSAYGTIYSEARMSTGGSTALAGGVSTMLPYWVKVSRSGNTFSSYTSLDGVNWVQRGASQAISMAQTVYVGLAVNSGSSTAMATATFDNVSVSSASASAPVISGVSATTGAVGSPVVITGTGFGATQGSSVVRLNGVAVPVNTWSGSSISVTIPAGATTGPLAVSVAPAMNDSNPVVFTVTTQPLPSPWLDQDVGSLGVIGSTSYANGVFTVKGAGAQIYGTVDAFHYVYQPLTGDGTLVARLVSVQGGTGYVSPGVMIRETLNAGATNAGTVDWASYGTIYFEMRASTGGSTALSGGVGVTLPYWVKVSRSGSTFSSYTSADGVTWTQRGSQVISMAQTVYVGLAVNSGSASSVATTTFDNVSITIP